MQVACVQTSHYEYSETESSQELSEDSQSLLKKDALLQASGSKTTKGKDARKKFDLTLDDISMMDSQDSGSLALKSARSKQ